MVVITLTGACSEVLGMISLIIHKQECNNYLEHLQTVATAVLGALHKEIPKKVQKDSIKRLEDS